MTARTPSAAELTEEGAGAAAAGASRASTRRMRIMPIVVVALCAVTSGAQAERAEKAAPFRGDIVKMAQRNTDFRRVLFTGENSQVVVMSLRQGEDIGEESHPVDQCFFFVAGKGQGTVAGKAAPVAKDDVLCVPAGARHNIRNTGAQPLKLFTIYAPPQHPAGTVHRTKTDAQRGERERRP